MQVGACLGLGRQALARSCDLAYVAHLVEEPARDRLGPGLGAARGPRLVNPADVVAEAETRELLGVESAHPGHIERERGGLSGARTIGIAGHVNRTRRLDGDRLGIAS